MKKFTKVLAVALSVIMVFSMIAVSAACKKDPKLVTVTYYDNGVLFDSYTVTAGKLIPADKVAQDPVPAANKVFQFWADVTGGGSVENYIATGKPTADVILTSIYRDRNPGEIVVSFDTNGGKPNVPTQIVSAGDKVTAPGEVKLSGGTFNMWREQGASDPFDFAGTQIYADTVIEASWDEGDGKVLVLSSGNFDKVFSPFFATSAYDSEVAGVTQVSMLSSNAEGKVYVGDDVPTVVKSYTEKTYVNGVEDKNGSLVADLPEADLKKPEKCKTVYEFVIKNDIQFSDGTPLTIKDVLFNLYVYLDPVYTGSSTIYSTNIIGLTAYRSQDPDAADGAAVNTSRIDQLTLARIQNLRDYYYSGTDSSRLNSNREIITGYGEEEHLQVFTDLQRLRMYYYKELVSDWNNYDSIENIAEDYKEYGFKESWEVFLFNNGLITAEYNSLGEVKTIDDIPLKDGGIPDIDYGNTKEFEHGPEYLIPFVFNGNMGILTQGEIGSNYMKGSPVPKVDLLFNENGVVDEVANLSTAVIGDIKTDLKTSKANLIARGSNGGEQDGRLRGYVNYASRYRSSGQELSSYIKAAITADYLRSRNPSGEGLLVPNISGITAHNNGNNDVLKIEIVGVDPKAIWNFGFTVAPMHYYSDPSTKTGFDAKDGYTNFTYPGVGGVSADSTNYHLGFKQCDLNYFQGVINHSSVQGVPVGAGTFKASNARGKTTSALSEFCDNNVVHLRRNDFFETTGDKMSNAKFEYLKYKVVDTSKMIDSLEGREVDYGDPSATDDNISTVGNIGSLAYKLVDNNGFGYVGVNAKHVPDLFIRQAIMTALDTELIQEYYGDNAQIIHVPMSTVSWAYPENPKDKYPYQNSDTALKKTIKDYVSDAGYDGLIKNSKGAYGRDHTELGRIYLEYEFVVAGTSTEHPAYQMFLNAATILNDCGFNITVKNDAFALSKLASGGLAIWAAAWSAGIDPDMYQVYHYKSTASSIKNWGFAEILQFGTTQERQNLIRLAELIEEGRQTTNEDQRKLTYTDALDKLMDLAVEYPTYQRKNMFVYDKTKIDARTLNQNPSPYSGLLSRLWEVKLLK